MNPSPTKIPQIKTRGLPTCFESLFEENGGDDRHAQLLQASTRGAEYMPPGTPGYKIKQAFQENLAAANSCSANSNLISPRSGSEQASPVAWHMSPNAGQMSPADKQVNIEPPLIFHTPVIESKLKGPLTSSAPADGIQAGLPPRGGSAAGRRDDGAAHGDAPARAEPHSMAAGRVRACIHRCYSPPACNGATQSSSPPIPSLAPRNLVSPEARHAPTQYSRATDSDEFSIQA
jgi:hypothetical protein